MKQQEQKYGLMTAISMIVGISVGSGIFFKIDDILSYTNGNMALSVVIFVLGALCIIFGSITLSQLAAISNKSGGIIGYAEEFISPAFASAFAWFQLFVYYPTIVVVVSWVAGTFTTTLFGKVSTIEFEILIGLIYLTFFYGLNYMSTRLGGLFQNIATVIKIIPLIGLGLVAIFWNQPDPLVSSDALSQLQDSQTFWLAALAPMAFSYDGWIITTSITQEVKNPNRTMPLALSIGPIIVLVVYLFYLFGMTTIASPEFILVHGDDSIYYIGKMLMGDRGGTIITAFILIAILGVINGISLGHIRLPQLMAEKGMIPQAEHFKKINLKTYLSQSGVLLTFIISLVWLAIHYLTLKFNLLGQGDIGEVAIAFSYILYSFLYVRVFQLRQRHILTSTLFAGIFPILALVGALVIIFGNILINPVYVPFFLLFNAIFAFAGVYYYRKTQSSKA